MERHADYVSGWIDTTIHDFLSEIDEPSSSMAYALITCLDSCFDLPPLLQKSAGLQPLKGKCERVGRGLLLTTRQLLAAERRSRIFFGFDEVWFFPDADVRAKPAGVTITGPEKINDGQLEKLSGWMRESRCSLGLGDGTGMNFCLRVRGAARYIVKALGEVVSDEDQVGDRSTAAGF